MLMPDLKWCCSGFEVHLLKSEKKHGVGIAVIINYKAGVFCTIQNWKDASSMPEGGFAIKFCPWCGRNLKQWFDAQNH